MTITLSYLDDLSRVRIQASGLAPGYVRVERSINGGLLWETVRGASALEVVGGAIQIDDYEFAPDIENTYRVVAAVNEQFDRPSADQVWGDPWEVPPGVRSLVVDCWGAGGSPAGGSEASAGGGGGAYAASTVDVTPGETLRVRVGGVAPGTAGGASALIRGETLLVQAAGGGAPEDPDTPGGGGVASFPASIGDVTAAGGDGGDRESDTGAGGGGGGSGGPGGAGTAGSAGDSGTGGTGGTGAGDGGDGGDTGQDAGHGETPGGGGGGQGAGGAPGLGAPGRVTLHSWPAGTPESDSITPSLNEKVWLKSIRYPALNRVVQVRFRDESLGFPARMGLHAVKSKAAPVAVFDQRGSRQHTLTVRVDSAEDARNLELVLMVSGELLLHVPADSTVPGGYLAVGDLSRVRTTAGSPYWWTLPCTLVEPPGPEVTPTTLTWGTVHRLYGSWSALLAAHPTWADLLATVGDPDDPVVL